MSHMTCGRSPGHASPPSHPCAARSPRPEPSASLTQACVYACLCVSVSVSVSVPVSLRACVTASVLSPAKGRRVGGEAGSKWGQMPVVIGHAGGGCTDGSVEGSEGESAKSQSEDRRRGRGSGEAGARERGRVIKMKSDHGGRAMPRREMERESE
eukprot:3101072-Rhodomonas_salina.2